MEITAFLIWVASLGVTRNSPKKETLNALFFLDKLLFC